MRRAMLANPRSTTFGLATFLALILAKFGLPVEWAEPINELIMAIAIVASLFLQRDGDK